MSVYAKKGISSLYPPVCATPMFVELESVVVGSPKTLRDYEE